MHDTKRNHQTDQSHGGCGRRDFLSSAAGGAALAAGIPAVLTSASAPAQMPPPTYTLAERDRRWANVRGLMSKQGVDCLIVPYSGLMGGSHLGYATYLTNGGFGTTPGAVVFPLVGEPTLIGVTPPHPDVPPGWISDYTWKWSAAGQLSIADHIISKVYERGCANGPIGVIGIQANVEGGNEFANEGLVNYAMWSTVLAGLPNAVMVDLTLLYAELIMVKGKEELRQYEKAAMVGERLHKTMIENTHVGMSDKAFRIMVAEYLINNDARADVQALFLAPGNIRNGQVINSEYGIIYAGGYAQVTLCLAVGKTDRIIGELAEVAYESLEYGKRHLKPGARFGDVIAGMEEIVSGKGYWHGFPQVHSLRPMFMAGPVYNLAPPSYPSKTIGADVIIKENMMFSFEPGAKSGTGMMAPEVKIGSTSVVTKNGPRLFNTLGQKLQQV